MDMCAIKVYYNIIIIIRSVIVKGGNDKGVVAPD
jgi:hypothetical protein